MRQFPPVGAVGGKQEGERGRAGQPGFGPAGATPSIGRTIPYKPAPAPRTRRSTGFLAATVSLVAICVGLAVWAWREESGRSRAVYTVPAGVGGQSPASASASPSLVPAAPRDEGGPIIVAHGSGSSEESRSGAGPAPEQEPPATFPTAAGGQDASPAAMILRGDEFLARSDVVSARLFYLRAATAGSAEGATAMARTFDPVVLERRSVRGASPDPEAALEWYRRGAERGDFTANAATAALLDRLQRDASAGDPEARAILARALR